MPSAEIIKKFEGQLAKAKWPEHLTPQIDFPGWVRAVINGDTYTEPIEDYISRMLAIEAMMAPSVEQVFMANNVKGLQEILPNVPGATTGPHEILDLYVTASSFEKGHKCYVIVEWLNLDHGHKSKWTTGATNIQASLIGLLKFGHWPIRCQVKRGDSKDKGDRYLMFLLPPD